jgi:ubiquinone/menaquinone biosynthesis C-methylase UbiE
MAAPVDEVFADEFFASIYDYFNPWTPSDQFYLELTRETGPRVLDLGCGTGMLACRIAADGCAVTGVDAAKGMLRVSRSREGAERVTWIAMAALSRRSGTSVSRDPTTVKQSPTPASST